MKCEILHESRGRLRFHVCRTRMTIRQADLLDLYLRRLEFVNTVKVYERTGDAVIRYREGCRGEVLSALARFQYENAPLEKQLPENSGRELNRQYQDKLVSMAVCRAVRSLFFPAPLKAAYAVFRSIRYLWRGFRCLLQRKLQVEVLDAISIGVSLLRRDYSTASSVMFLLRLGELLEEWTHKKSLGDLARSMALDVDRVWLVTTAGDVLIPIHDARSGDRIRVRAGNLIPLDGKVIGGEAMVNQASLTGESVPIPKRVDSLVYAGTVLEEGECVVEVSDGAGGSRYDRIVTMIEESQKLQSSTVFQAMRLADRLVPYSLLGTVVTYAVTRNATRAVSILMVDFSCALKLAMPLSFLSAMGEAGKYHITVKGGKFLESIAKADTIVFDKTGTLTKACPTVVDVVPFGGSDPKEMLRLAACLEEHFPHSIANAVVKAAQDQDLPHDEMHAKVEYLVAHGIASTVEGQRVVIGSYHFVFEDEGCSVPEGEQETFNALPLEYSQLYLAVSGRLAAVICVADPLRPEAPAVLKRLHALGISRLVMMTGDSERTAAAIAREVGADEYHAEVLPEDKAAFVEAEKAAGRTVIMIGDGINDAPALSAADVGIAISDGAAIAREIADVTISADSLDQLCTLRRLSQALADRVGQNYRTIMGFNGSLIVLGALGVLPPATSALLHNLSTLSISLKSMTPLLDGQTP